MSFTTMHVTIVLLVALAMRTTLAYALEMPAQMRLSGPFWVKCQHTLCRFFRYIGGPIAVAAKLISTALAYFIFGRNCLAACPVASSSLIIAPIVWVAVTERVNRQVALWTATDGLGEMAHAVGVFAPGAVPPLAFASSAAAILTHLQPL